MATDNHLRILVIDDNLSIHEDFKKILLRKAESKKFDKLNEKLFGVSPNPVQILPLFQIDTATQGIEGLEKIKEALLTKKPYALAFVDIRMPPGWDGIETIKHIWQIDKDIQIVICTAFSDYSWEETIEQLGMSDNLMILKKPFDSMAVRQFACALTQKWKLMQETKKQTGLLEKTVRDRTDSLQKSLSRIEHQNMHDPLTALPNRILLMDRVDKAIAHARRSKSLIAVMFIDLDRFKMINNSFSHEAGDSFLVTLSTRLKKITRSEDTIARVGGDKFILVSVFESILKQSDIIQIAAKILHEISMVITIEERNITVTASLGISIYPQDGDNSRALLRNADLAMSRAKALGGNQFHFYTQKLNVQSLLRLERESDLRSALLNNEFYLEYQPQYDSQKQCLSAVEALIRWKHPKLGILMPIDFIPLAEDTGLIVPIGEWVIKTACAQVKSWQEQGLPSFSVAVNVATKQFMHPQLVKQIRNVLKTTGLLPQYLEIEVTENVIISTFNVIETIRKLKKMGVKIVLDDFGTGNSGLNYLRNLPIDQIKIDKTFVNNIHSNRSDEVIIEAMISMAKSLNLDVIAEGIENEAQLKYLQNQSCKKFQGYYFSHPVSAGHVEEIIIKWNKTPL